MATRSIIAVKDGKQINSVYCHWDGYPSGVGETLFNHYQSLEKIKELISLGCISSLGENVNPPLESLHSFETPDENTTVFYGRDRGEKDTDHKETKTTIQLSKLLDKCGAEWLYLFKGGSSKNSLQPQGKWFFKHYTQKELKELTENDVKE